jgi:tRNA (cmo5U34)-methyltransferase
MEKKEGFQLRESVNHQLKFADMTIPGRGETLSIVAKLATLHISDESRFLDVGCGWGDVTKKVLELCPHASVCMVDYSEEMLILAREILGDDKRIQMINHDLNNGLPDELRSDKFDAVFSCHALHHVEHENKVELYTQIKHVLNKGGLFINGDRFHGESPLISNWEFDNWIEWMVDEIRNTMGKEKAFSAVKKAQIEWDEKLGDKPGTIWDTQRDLAQVGFQYVDCVWKRYNMAIIVATNK